MHRIKAVLMRTEWGREEKVDASELLRTGVIPACEVWNGGQLLTEA